MAAKILAKIDHHTGMKILISAAVGMGKVVSLQIQNEAVRVDLPLDPLELQMLRDGLTKALEHCAKNT